LDIIKIIIILGDGGIVESCGEYGTPVSCLCHAAEMYRNLSEHIINQPTPSSVALGDSILKNC
jgi:hypothetical protein